MELIIESVQLYDSGVYTCVAKSEAGMDEVSLQINVNSPPTISDEESLSVYHKSNGDTVTFDCSVENVFPPPKVRWYKDGETIRSWQFYKELKLSKDRQFLKIPK